MAKPDLCNVPRDLCNPQGLVQAFRPCINVFTPRKLTLTLTCMYTRVSCVSPVCISLPTGNTFPWTQDMEMQQPHFWAAAFAMTYFPLTIYVKDNAGKRQKSSMTHTQRGICAVSTVQT